MKKIRLGILGEIWLPISEEMDCLGKLEEEICERTSTHLILRSRLFYVNKKIKVEVKLLKDILEHIFNWSTRLAKPYRIALAERFIKGCALIFVSFEEIKQQKLYNNFKDLIDNTVQWTFNIQEIKPLSTRHFERLINEVHADKTLDFKSIELESISLCELWSNTLEIKTTTIISPLLGGLFVAPVIACLKSIKWEYINYSMYDRKVNVAPTYTVKHESCIIVDDNVGTGKSMREVSKILDMKDVGFLAFEMNWSKYIRAKKGILDSFDPEQFLRCSPLWYRHFENLKIWQDQFAKLNFIDYPDYLSYIHSCVELTDKYKPFLPDRILDELSVDLLQIKDQLVGNGHEVNRSYIDHQLGKTGL